MVIMSVLKKLGTIKAVIIGLGRIASLLEDDPLREKPCTHAGALAANGDCALAAGCDLDAERRRLFSARWGCPVYGDAAVMLNEVKPDLVCVATHPDSHFFYCRLAAENGASVIVCEKPLADTLSEARKIASLVKRTGVRILCNHERRYSADYLRAKTILDEERLGRLLSVSARLYMGQNARLVDVLWHDGTHLADAAMFLTGMTLRHRKTFGADLTKGNGTAWLEGILHPYASANAAQDTPFIMEIGAGRDHLVFELEFSCARGRLRIGNGVFEVWESRPSAYAANFRSLAKTDEQFKGPTGYFSNMIADAAACCRDKERVPISNADCALHTIEYLRSVKRWK
jgi:predicted dehydrogenase